MALPLIPFAAGVAIGGLITYLLKDERVHRRVVEGARRASGVGREGMDYLKTASWPGRPGHRDEPGQGEAAPESATEAAEVVAEGHAGEAAPPSQVASAPRATRSGSESDRSGDGSD
jgi:hypothetical protein